MAARKRHEHQFGVLTYSKDARNPRIVRVCRSQGCVSTVTICPLCEEDGNARRHKRRHLKIEDRIILNRSILALSRAALEHEKLWGKIGRSDPCRIHGPEHWRTSKVATGYRVCIICHPAHPESIYGEPGNQ